MSMQRKGSCYIADTARVMGEVTLGADANVWYGAVIRGDVARITIGQGSNVQDNAVVHCDSGHENVIGDHVTIGHSAVVHGRSVGEGTLIGMHATVLGGTVIGRGCLIGAGAVVPPGLQVPDGMLVVGVPGRIVRPLNQKEQDYLKWLAPHYVKLARLYHEQPGDVRTRPYEGQVPPTVV